MEEVTRKKDLSSRIKDVKLNFVRVIIKFLIIVALIFIIFVPYKKAEFDDAVVLVNPLTLTYCFATYDKDFKRINDKARGIATKGISYDSGKEEKYYNFGLLSIKESDFDNKGKLSFWQALNICLFI